MGQSFRLLETSHAPTMSSTPAPTRVLSELTHPRSRMRYRVTSQAERLTFHQRQGAIQDARNAYAVIGGQHAQTYLWRDADALFEAPLTLYGSRWDLSPGYEARDHGLYRPITAGCLHCHSESLSARPSSLNRYVNLPRQGINCARCHGDTRAHVTGRYAGRDTPAINPKALSPDRAQEVCDQCHFGGAIRITREGKTWADYIPGEPLSDTIAIMVRQSRSQGLGSVSHRDRLQLSACAQGPNQLGCATCHQPHEAKPQDPNSSCRTCHADRPHPPIKSSARGSLSGPQAQLKDRCVDCHMRHEGLRNVPHLSTLDHWIRRTPTPEPPAHNSDAPLKWVARDSTAPLTPDDHLLLGRAYYKAWRQDGQAQDLRRAYEHLTTGLPQRLNAARAWGALAELSAEVSISGALPALRGPVGHRVAFDAAQRAYLLDPTRWEVVFLLSDLYLRSGQPDRARALLDRHQRLDPQRAELQRRRAQILRIQGALREAEELLESVISHRPFDVRSHFDYGLIFQSAQRWSDARRVFQRVLSLEPQWREAQLNLGWIELQDQRYSEALTLFKPTAESSATAQVSDQLRAQALAGQALALEQLGALPEAQRSAERAVQLGVPVPGVWSLMGRAAIARRDYTGARSAFQRAVSAHPSDGRAWWGLAQAQSALTDKTSARDSAQRAARLGVEAARDWLKAR